MKPGPKVDTLRRDAFEAGVAELYAKQPVSIQPGFYGRLELVLQDGFVESVRVEQTKKIPRPLKVAA